MKVTIKPPVERTVTIEMTENEAQSLLIICGYIGGFSTTRRGHFDNLSRALKGADIKVPSEDNVDPKHPSIWFEESESTS